MSIIIDKLTEDVIASCVKEFLINKTDGNWHEDKIRETALHEHGPDLVLVGGQKKK